MNSTAVSEPSKKQLPTVEDRSGADVVIYDGHCKFCAGSVRILYRLDFGKRLAFLSLHDAKVQEVAPDLTYDQMMEEMWVVDQKGRYHSGAAGFRYLTRKLVPLWPLMPLLHIPGSLPLWKWAYRNFAAIRYRFGRIVDEDDCGDACSVHFGKKT